MNSTAIIVLNWNSAGDTIKCVESLITQSSSVDIIIVDNASSDSSPKDLKEYVDTTNNKSNHHSSLFFLSNNQNLGFSGGINTGIRFTLDKNYTYIGLLNPDATADHFWAERLTSGFTHDTSIGIVTGLLLHRDGKTVDSTGEFYPRWGLPGPRDRDLPVEKSTTTSGHIFGGTGGATIYKASLLRDIGLFDETFFMYYEDVDLSFRAQLAGYTAYFVSDAIAYHAQGTSSKKVPGLTTYNSFKNLPLLLLKNIPGSILAPIFVRFIILYGLIYASALVHGKGWPATKGVISSIILLPYGIRQRIHIQRNRRSSVGYIKSLIYHSPVRNHPLHNLFRKQMI